MFSIEISSESNVRILKEASKRCQFVDDARDIDPAAGADQEQAFLALSGSVNGSTFLECCETIRLNSMGRKPSECTLAALPENPVAAGRYYLSRKQRII